MFNKRLMQKMRLDSRWNHTDFALILGMVRHFLLLLTAFFFFQGKAQSSSSDTLAIRDVIQGFFKGMHQNDTNLVKQNCCFAPDFKHISGKMPRFRQESFQGFLDFVGNPQYLGKIDERNTIESIQLSGPMAVVWCPYEFYMDGKFSHKGVNSITLIKSGREGWKICGLIDTREK